MEVERSNDSSTPGTTSADAPASGPTRSPWQRVLLRGENTVASVGISLAAILLGSMAGAAWWTVRTQRGLSESARDAQVHAVATLLAQSAEPLLADNELSTVRCLVTDAARTQGLSVCRIVLPNGQVIADAQANQITAINPPASWAEAGESSRPREHIAAQASAGGINLNIPLNVAGRGPAELRISADASSASLLTSWDAIAGIGAIGAVGMVLLLLVYRQMRSRLRGMTAVREAMLAARDRQIPISTLQVSTSLGEEAEAWNGLLADLEKARQRDAAEKVRGALGRRRQSKGDLESACDAMSQGLLLVDEAGRVKYANGAAAAFLRTDREKLTGGELSKFLMVPKVLEAVGEIAKGTLRRRSVIDIERKEEAGEDGAGVLRFSVRPVRREDSAAAMVVIEDVTQQKAAEAARHHFVAHATHELRTPLTNIRLYVETAIEDGENDPATRARCLNVINGEARRLERIVGEMLSVAEMEAGSFKLKSDDVRLDQLFEDIKADFQESAKDKQIALTFELPPKLPVAYGDRDKVVLALHNLVGNALKYTPSGGKVTVSVRAEAGRLAVAVKDTGFGISTEDQERIFERFYRAKDSRVAKITGTGLGLTLAREVARLHGGDIAVESALNAGSTFTLTLPISAAA